MSNGKDKKKLKKHEFTPLQLREIEYSRARIERELKARRQGKQEYGVYGKREREPKTRESSPEEEKLVAENLRLRKLEAKKALKEYRLKKRKKTAKKKKTTKTLARRPALPH